MCLAQYNTQTSYCHGRAGYCLALDLTARNLQDKAKKKGHPWTVAKGYDTFTPIR
jgi:acylpyruvate hydrolase